MRIVFLGTPAFAVPTLQRLAGSPAMDLIAAVCQPDRPAGRGRRTEPPPVKQAAAALGLPVFQPERMRAPDAVAWLEAQDPDVLAVVAYGQLLPASVFTLPRWGAINAHASLLPAYRGAAPIQWAIARGEHRTGVTTMRINAGLDTGDLLLRREVAIGAGQTAPELSAVLAPLAAELMFETLRGLELGKVTATPQPERGTFAPRLSRADGQVDWNQPATEIYNRWRGFQPWPGIYTHVEGRQLTIVGCHPLACGEPSPPGTWMEIEGTAAVACGGGALGLDAVKVEGRATVAAADFARGARLRPGVRLGAVPSPPPQP